MSYKTRSRQVHLDFHTSPLIEGIGKDFNKEEFGEVLEKARVNSITCFARCHHGYLYYDSKINKERIHPNLVNKNLLKEQIEACHERNIKAPIYLPVQWDKFTYDEHPEWVSKDLDGNIIKGEGGKPGFYEFLCVNTPYRDFLKNHVREILEMFPEADGLFFDIVMVVPCACENCKKSMEELGIDYTIKGERLKFSEKMLNEFKHEMTEFVKEINENVTIFYNGSHISPALKDSIDSYSHIEIESLPSGGWGYMHFPITVRYARNLGKDCLGMTGKFHTYWGDFHSFKNLAALQYECFNMLAQNTKCSIGDQLDPSGKISKEVYDLIGKVYSEVEQKEPWCEDAKQVCEIAVFTPEEFIDYNAVSPFGLKPAITGATRMLQEASLQFDIIDSKMDFNKYKLLVLPERTIVNDEFKEKLESFVRNGGKVIAVNEGGLNEEGNKFNLPFLKVNYESQGEFAPTFIVPEGNLSKDLYNTEYVMYEESLKVSAQDGAEVLSYSIEPYFNRTPEHFCSHQHAPSSGKVYGPAIIKGDNSIYFAHKIFSQYQSYGSVWCKKLFINAIDMLLDNRLVKHDGPSTIISTLNEQEKESRYILHLLHYVPERRCQRIDVIEDIIPIYNLNLNMVLDKNIKSVKLVPQNENVDFNIIDGKLEFTVNKINGHQMVEISY
ncbi:beta-galactosidase trimerization domain-containing protein [Clostridium sp.]|uniref:beta-galactosidase trimerization domain-containing protein n=1 Tax=Clostridium sp. TaxID=1506 RepID=UPI0026DD9499|nr:beta-galactosidase trimerization domain-containing protein [Clostridium sp.]MDO5039395.1 beta-galactosidase trimerization domain-containing protein [Clostridium sp.]